MMCPPHRVKTVSTPSFASARAARCPPEMTLSSRLLRARVSSAVLDFNAVALVMNGSSVVAFESSGAGLPARPQQS